MIVGMTTKEPKNLSGIELRSLLLGTAQRRFKQCDDVPNVGRIFVQSMTERERGEVETAPPAETCARLIIKCLVDEEGNRLFSDTKEDLQAVLSMDSQFTQPIFNEIAKHCTPATQKEQEKDIKN